MSKIPFVNSNIGHLEFELCNILHKTPKEIGKLRQTDAASIEFFERYIIAKWKREYEAAKERKRQAQASQRKSRRRR